MSLSSLAAQCDRLLTQSNRSLNNELNLELGNVLTRLRIWAGHVGAFAPGNASINYRLRDDPDVADVFVSMLHALRTNLERALNPPLVEEEEWTREGNPKQRPGSPASSSASSSALELDSDAEEMETTETQGNLGHQTYIRKANDIIDRLYRLSSVMRKPASSTENARVRDLFAKKPEWAIDELEDVEDHTRSHILAHFGNASRILVDRLVSASVFRRMKLCYRKRHQEKLRQGVSYVGEHRQLPSALATQSLVSRSADQLGLPELYGPDAYPIDPENARQHPESIALSGTNASSVNRQTLPGYAKSSVLSGITRAAIARRQHLDVPSPPGNLNEGQLRLECPYCFRFIRKEETEEPHWT